MTNNNNNITGEVIIISDDQILIVITTQDIVSVNINGQRSVLSQWSRSFAGI